jgi:hypothetical protein
MTKADKLANAARAAAEVRAYQTDPDVVALRVERVRAWVDRLIWTGMTLGLLFTMANVAHFAGGDAKKWTLPWTTAWLLDPTVSLVLIGILMGEQIINRHKLDAGGWVRTTKWVALACTYAMNTWSAWESLNPAQILLHSVPPAIVFCAAEAVVTIRQKISEAVTVAYDLAAKRNAALEQARTAPAREDAGTDTTVPGRTYEDDGGPDRTAAAQTVRTTPAQDRTETPRTDRTAPVRDNLRTETDHRTGGRMREEARNRTAKPNGTSRKTPVDREAIVAELAEEFREAVAAGTKKWVPNWDDLMERTGYRKSWCEKAARDARQLVFDTAEDRPDDADAEAEAEDRTAQETVRAGAEPDRTETIQRDRTDPRTADRDGDRTETTQDAATPIEPYAAEAEDRTDAELVGAGGRS